MDRERETDRQTDGLTELLECMAVGAILFYGGRGLLGRFLPHSFLGNWRVDNV